MNIVLIGYRGTGKSTVAAILASRLSWQTISTDEEIIRQAQLSIPDIVARFGWDHFRNLESEVCRSLGERDHLVIDTGGGVIVKPENVEALKPKGLFFWLTATVPIIIQRIGGNTQRPPLKGGKTFIEEIEEVLREREPKYAAAGNYVLATDCVPPEQIADQVLGHLSSHQWSER